MRHLPRFGQPQGNGPGNTWETVRRPARHNDEALTGTTRAWLRKLPVGRRPMQLCTQYPRLANQIAWSWADPVRTRDLLDDLLVDRRGGRAGFPSIVAHELRRLRDFSSRAAEPGPDDSDPPANGYLELLRRFWSRH